MVWASGIMRPDHSGLKKYACGHARGRGGTRVTGTHQKKCSTEISTNKSKGMIMYSMSNAANLSGLRLIAIFGMTLGLAACGGGDSAPASGGVALPTAPVTITSTNQGQVAGAVVDTAIEGYALSATGVQSSTGTKSAVDVALRVGQLAGTAAKQIAAQAEAPATATGVVRTYDCLISGTYTIDITMDATTSATSTYTSCSNAAGETVNGTMIMSNINFNAAGSIVSFDATFNLSFTSSGGSATATGDMHQATDPTTNDTTISGSSLTFTDSVYGNEAMQNYSITTDINGNTTAMTFTYASSALGGTATFNLVTRFMYNLGSMFPNTGSGMVTGGNSTKLKVTVLGDENAAGNQVQLELSTDNGATYGAPAYVTWASISRNL